VPKLSAIAGKAGKYKSVEKGISPFKQPNTIIRDLVLISFVLIILVCFQ
jgi:hypothetical protein